MKKSLMVVFGILMLGMVSCNSGNNEEFKNLYEKDMAWWQEARFGMFIHWGISSLMGQEISWTREGYGAARYDSLALRFNPTDFDADQWIAGRKTDVDPLPLYGKLDTHFLRNRDILGQYYETDATLEVDLRQAQSVSRFRILHGGDHPVGHVALEYLKDGEWETAASTDQFNAEWTGTIAPTEARHWRLNMQDGFMEFGVREFQLFKE